LAAHDVGDVIRLWAVFRDAAGAQVAPTTVELTVRTPAGAVSTATVTPAEVADETLAEAATGETLSGVTGVYRSDVAITQSGRWWYRWAGSGSLVEAEEGRFDVRQRRVG
jgi:hypothetical protein